MTDAQKKALALARARLRVKNNAPQFAENGAPINQAAKAELIAKAKSGTLTLSPEREAQQAEINATMGRPRVDPGPVGSALIGAADTMTAGFADEILAGAMSPFTDQTYAETRDGLRNMQSDAEHFNPKTTLGAGLAGAVALPVGAMGTGGKIGWRVAKGAATGAGLSGMYGFGSGEDGFKSRALAGAKSMPLGAALGGAVPVVGAGLQKFLNSRAGRAYLNKAAKGAPSVEEMRAAASKLYGEVDAAGVQIKPEAFDRARGSILDDLRANTGFDELPGGGSLTPFSARANEIMGAASNRMAGEPTAALPFKALDQMRRQAGAAAGNVTNPTDQGAGMSIINGLDDFVRKLGPDDVVAGDIGALNNALPKARDMFHRMSKSQKVEDVITGSQDYLSGRSSGINNGFKNLLKSKKAMRGFSDAEKAAIRAVIKGGPIEGLISLGSGKIGQMALTAAGGGAGTAGGPVGAMVGAMGGAAVGQGARALAERIALSKAERVRAIVANGTATALPKASPAARKALERIMMQSSIVGGQQ